MKLLEQFEKPETEFGVKSADEYMQIGRDIMQKRHKGQYLYKRKTSTGFLLFMGNSRKKNGATKFGVVGTNTDGMITTIHVESGKSVWKTPNGNAADKTIRPVP